MLSTPTSCTMLASHMTPRVATPACQSQPSGPKLYAAAFLAGRPLAARKQLRQKSSAGKLCISAAAATMVESKPKTDDLVLIPGGKGKAVRMKKGDTIKIINTHGSQVVDFWAFSEQEWGKEIMSMHHTRNALQKSTPQAGDMLYTASMKPIMKFLEESGPGCHDTTAAACSYGLYVLQIGEEAAKEHDSCTNNLYNGLKELGMELTEDPRYGYYTPAPFNLWMNVDDKPDSHGYIWVQPPPEQKAGDYCIFRAEVDLVAAMSACPWDLGDMNGPGGKPQDCHFQVFGS